MRPRPETIRGLLLTAMCSVGVAQAQPDYGTRLGLQQGAEATFAPQGPGVMLSVLDPAVRRWYVPQELFVDYRWRQWQYTNYAREPYRRYIEITQEGDSFYDIYGNFVTRGWMIFNNSQTRPAQSGNVLLKSKNFDKWFSRVVVASDTGGGKHYSLTVSDRLRTTLTPMVFDKPAWDGVQFDLATDRYGATLIYSRISRPGGGTTAIQDIETAFPLTDNTILFGGRATAQVTDQLELGVHMINAHQSNTLSDRLRGNPFTGLLTQGQNGTVSLIEVVLRDDSPEDGEGGAAFFAAASDVTIHYDDGTSERGKKIGFEPIIEGGFVEKGFIAANGTEEIRLKYNFNHPAFLGEGAAHTKDAIERVEFDLVLGNDYAVWVTSDRQRDNSKATSQPVLLLVTRADGNVKDITNLRTVNFDYGLPSATHIFGGSAEVRDLYGFDLYGEYDLSWSYTKYPREGVFTHVTSSGIRGERSNPAWMVNVAKKAYPWFVFGEFYSMDPLYNTQTFISDGKGQIDYARPRVSRLELVDDNDDHDQIPDLQRADSFNGDARVFPGWDQNNDFVPDINQNDGFVVANRIPDYEEPFLRFHVDRPEFLFGMDMNNNFWVDQYENDEEPDYPYRKDHEGYNVYGGLNLAPGVRVTVGVLREELLSSNHKNHSTYAILSLERDWARLGRVRFFEMTKLVEDDIPNTVLQWDPRETVATNELSGLGALIKLEDPLLARETWVNQVFLGHDIQTASLFVRSKLNYVLFHQLMKMERREAHGLGNATDYFFGVINKASYRYTLGRWVLEPRWKSEFRKQTRELFQIGSRTSLTEIFSAIVETEVLRATRVQLGTEFVIFNDFDEDFNDFDSQAVAVQFVSDSEYIGYAIRALTGVTLVREDFKGRDSATTLRSFVTIFAGLERM